MMNFLMIYNSLKSKLLSTANLITAYVGIYHVATSDGHDIHTTALRRESRKWSPKSDALCHIV